MADLTATLIAASSADQNAENVLTEWKTRNYPEFIVALAVELSTEGKDLRARQLAGLYLKNELYAKEESLQLQKHDQWKALGDDVRNAVKRPLLQAFGSPIRTAWHTAAQAAAEVAAIEMPYNAWPEFVPTMRQNVAADTSDDTKIASLECLGFSCERIAALDHLPNLPETAMNEMLTAIIDGLQQGRPADVRLAAAVALKNSILFASSNMERKVERDSIMNSIGSGTVSEDARVRKESFACITSIVVNYYDKLPEYMGQLYEMTTKCIREDEELVAKEGLEFWSTMCETEIEYIDDELEQTNQGLPVTTPCQRYVLAATEHLAPLVLAAMAKQPEEVLDPEAEEEFTISIAAATCLSLMASTVEDAITNAVLPFVHQHIQNADWHFREAATMAFACILQGVSTNSIGVAVQQSIPLLMEALSDNNFAIKDTTAFAISKICEAHSQAIPSQFFPTLVNGLMGKLATEPPRVAAHVCSALNKLAAAFDGDNAGEQTGTNSLSPYMQSLLQATIAAADRPDAMQANLRVVAFESVSVFVQNSAPDTRELLLQLLPAIIERLKLSFDLVAQPGEMDIKADLQALLCGLIQTLCQKLGTDFEPYADDAMTYLLKALQTKNNTCQAEAIAAMAAIATSMETRFERFMAVLQPFLLAGLRQYSAYQICEMSVGLVVDITRGLEGRFLPYTQDIMNALIDSLKDSTLHRSVKPPVLAAFGDIALAIEEQYEPYLQISMMMLVQAAATPAPEDDEDMIEYVNLLRDSVMEAFTGIIQGMKSRVDLLVPYLGSISQFLQRLSADTTRDMGVLSKAVALIGDLASVGPASKEHVNHQYISQLLQEGIQSGDEDTVGVANWAGSVVQVVLQQQ